MDNTTENKAATTASTAAEEAAEEKTTYAVRPQHRRHKRLEYSDKGNMLVVRNWLNIAFMALALVGVVLWTQMEDRTLASILLIIAVVLKIAEVSIRLFRK